MLRLTAYAVTDLQKMKNILAQMDAQGLSARQALLQVEQAMSEEYSLASPTGRQLRREKRREARPVMTARKCPDCAKLMVLTSADETQPELAVLVCRSCARSVFEGKTFAEYIGG